ncbi:MAG: 50S ribosomal protein L9 [Patescibacteria group bacterium]
MRVILLQNIKGFGQIGEVKSVSDGHARNFLFPKKLAKIATENTLKEVAALSLKREVMTLKNQEAVQKAVLVLATISLEFKKKASPTGTLFSSVTRHEIAHELTKLSGLKVETEMIDIGEHGEHIKHLGEHVVTVELANGLKTDVKVSIKNEQN